jgi:hypothetical protein
VLLVMVLKMGVTRLLVHWSSIREPATQVTMIKLFALVHESVLEKLGNMRSKGCS